ncbi:MAG: SEC-C domain-containing protein, partial [Deltaproteobacteria bacterium]|nr:SEC-C domain-containing protein [Deltaproteobacteria bacterium]
IESAILSRGIESAQKQVEGRNFEIRKHLLEYDDVMNRQREVVYGQRRHLLAGESLRETVRNYIDEESQVLVHTWSKELKDGSGGTDYGSLARDCEARLGFRPDPAAMENLEGEDLMDFLCEGGQKHLDSNYALLRPESAEDIFRWLMLNSLDSQWKDHLLSMDRLKEGISLRGYGQKDPLREYQREGFEMFQEMADRVRSESVSLITRARFTQESDPEKLAPKERTDTTFSHGGDDEPPPPPKVQPSRRIGAKVGRNDPCPCGSGKKYKHCCGAG